MKATWRKFMGAAACGGGTVEVPAGKYLTGSIYLKDDIDFHVGAGAELVASTDREDYNAYDVCPQNCIRRTRTRRAGTSYSRSRGKT